MNLIFHPLISKESKPVLLIPPFSYSLLCASLSCVCPGVNLDRSHPSCPSSRPPPQRMVPSHGLPGRKLDLTLACPFSLTLRILLVTKRLCSGVIELLGYRFHCLEKVKSLFLPIFFLFPFLLSSGTPIIPLLGCLELPCSSLCSFHLGGPGGLLSLCFILDSFCYAFKFTNFFFCLV